MSYRIEISPPTSSNLEDLHALLSGVYPAFSHIELTATGTFAVFSVETDSTEVSEIVSGFSPEEPFRIHECLSPTSPFRASAPEDINYKTDLLQRLHPRHEIIKGELVETIYYKQVQTDPTTGKGIYAEPVLKVSFTWIRNPLGMVVTRISTLSYYRIDDSLEGPLKVMEKFYEPEQALEEIRRRRTNMVNSAELTALGLLVMSGSASSHIEAVTMGRSWINGYAKQIEAFISTGDTAIIEAIQGDYAFWARKPYNGIEIRHIIAQELVI